MRRAPGPSARPRRAPRSASSPASASEAQQHQHQRERAGADGVEAELELGEDLDGEGPVLDDLKGAVLGQQAERHEQAAAEHRRARSGAA